MNEFVVDDVYIPERVHLALGVEHMSGGEDSDEMVECIDHRYVGKELVAQTQTLVGSSYQTRDVRHLHHGLHSLLRLEHLAQVLEPLVSNLHHPLIRLDCAERVVLARHALARQQVERARLTHVSHTHNPQLQRLDAAPSQYYFTTRITNLHKL